MSAPICPHTAPMSRECSIDRDPKKNEWVARRHLEGYNPTQMENMSRTMGMPIKRETIAKHLRECLEAPVGAKPEDIRAVAAKVEKAIHPMTPTEDVAVLVQTQVIEKLKAGEARVTVQHGLQAQQLLDRRAERAKDRELAITLARMLHAPGPPPHAIARRVDDEVIDGTAVEVI